MRDPLVTRRLLATIDRNIDVYVVLDRFRQAIYDQDDYIATLERAIKLLQDAERSRVTDTGVFKAIESTLNKREINFSKWILGALAAGLGALLLAAITWMSSMAWKGMTK